MKHKVLIFTFFICSGFCFHEYSGSSSFISSDNKNSPAGFTSGQHTTNQFTPLFFKSGKNQNPEINIRKSKLKIRTQGLGPCIIINIHCTLFLKEIGLFPVETYHASSQSFELLRAPPTSIWYSCLIFPLPVLDDKKWFERIILMH